MCYADYAQLLKTLCFRTVVEGLEFAKDSEVRGGAESVFEFGQGSDLVGWKREIQWRTDAIRLPCDG